MKLLPAFLVLAIPAAASANDLTASATEAGSSQARDRGYLGVSGTILGPLFSDDATINVEAAIRLADSPLLARAVVGHGQRSDGLFDPSASLDVARIGLEADACDSDRLACLFVGGDLGVARAVWAADDIDVDAIAVARLGVDLGNDYVRVRAAGELGTQAGASLAVAHRF